MFKAWMAEMKCVCWICWLKSWKPMKCWNALIFLMYKAFITASTTAGSELFLNPGGGYRNFCAAWVAKRPTPKPCGIV